MSARFTSRIQVAGPLKDRFGEILTPAALNPESSTTALKGSTEEAQFH